MAITSLNQLIEINEIEIPDELKQIPQWVLWKAEWDGKKEVYNKVPYQINYKRASSTNSDTWNTFENIIDAVDYKVFHGVGFILTKDDDYFVLDIDDQENGQNDLAIELGQLTYAEKSPSGTGTHLFFKGKLPENRKKKRTDLDIELYDSNRFMTVTGYSIGQSEISDDQAILDNLYERFFKEEDFTFTVDYSETQENITDELSDEELIKKMTSSKSGQKIADLIKGEYKEYFDSPSEAVQSLLWHLAFWTRKNRQQMESIFVTYNNLTDKWDSKRGNSTWGQLELDKAIKNQPNVYDPESNQSSLKSILKEVRRKELANMEQVWIDEGKNGKKPTTIHPNRVAYILMKNVPFVLFDNEENTRLAMYVESDGIYTQNTNLIKRVISWLEPKFNSRKADDVIYHIKNTAPIKRKTNESHLIPVGNGVFNNRTKQLEPFTPDYIFTTKVNTPYFDNVKLPVIDGWDIESWIKSIANNDKEIEVLLWQVLNDSLNGNFTRKKALFLVGDGNNGKGTFQELIISVVGYENVANLKVNEFEHKFKLSTLEGKTVCIGDDVPVNVYVDDSSNFKSVVTGDYVLVEFKNKQPYGANFKCTVIQSTNGMPKFRDKTDGNLRRILIVPFKANFNGSVENRKIKDEYIKNEKVLQYVLHKAINLEFEQFSIPKASLEQLDIFRQDNDPVYEFKVNVFDKWDLKYVPKILVYNAYERFCDNNKYKPLSDRKFNSQLLKILGPDWNGDKQKKYSNDVIVKEINRIGEEYIGYFKLQYGKNYKSYENTRLKVVS
ncbi:phage/plasmid primase, P4 family [Macrococcus animalis]|uniref:phage/plasmid primase, P4 family n=1 Tax=Macrococcus animalis TaxID=3395467 RepID=UPI0039BE4728